MEPGHEDREYAEAHADEWNGEHASMEPGHEDREYNRPPATPQESTYPPQWSPVMKTGNTAGAMAGRATSKPPQWSPVMKTGNTTGGNNSLHGWFSPQWSPVMKTGNTWPWHRVRPHEALRLNGARS